MVRQRKVSDPRLYQIAVLAALLLYGSLRLDFAIAPARIALLLSSALLTQWLCTRFWRLPRFDPRSALISGLSLCLLLRVDDIGLVIAAAVLTIASKFILRWQGKHVFNPTNFGLAAMMLLSDRVWVSPGQWGSAVYLTFLLACLGSLVLRRAERSDITWALLASYAGLLFGRAAWLGDPWTIPVHQLQSGAFLIFAFFMISDPKTTPDSSLGRVAFAILVATVGVILQFGFYQANGLLWALFFCAPSVPLIDRAFGGWRYRWSHIRPALQST